MQAACAKVSTVSDFLDEAANRVSTLEAGLKEEEGKRNEGELKTQAALKDTRKELTRKADGSVRSLPDSMMTPDYEICVATYDTICALTLLESHH